MYWVFWPANRCFVSFSRIKHLYETIGGVHETQEDADAAEAETGKIDRDLL